MRTRILATTAALTAGAFMGMAGPANAQPQQNGLVNVNITDVAVQVPIGIAANVCDVNVAVLVNDLADRAAQCNADADSNAEITPTADSGPVVQQGLVNLNLDNVGVQVPIGIAANICDVNVAVLVSSLVDDAARCDADADSLATITPA
jgi:hypothetical protein